MTRIIRLAAVLLWAAPTIAADYSRSYAVVIRGERAGTETVEEKPGADGSLVSTSTHDLLVNDGMERKAMHFRTALTLARTTRAPVAYSCRYASGSQDSYEVQIRETKATRVLTRSGHTSRSESAVPPGFVLLDFNVFHHYDYLVGRYDAKKGGRQVFQNYIPLIGSTVPVALTEVEGSTAGVRSFRVEFVGIRTGVVSVDRNGRLVRLAIRDQDLEVVRE